MTLMSEITRVSNNIKAAYTALDGKGATLPAEGSQNSANLADTIDTITTGGGGNSYEYSEEFNTVINILDGLSTSGTLTQSSLQNDGWVAFRDGSAYAVMGTVFPKDTPFIIVRNHPSNNNLAAFKIPSDASYEEIEDNAGYYKITFGNNGHWVCVISTSYSYCVLSNARMYYWRNAISGSDEYVCPEAVYSKIWHDNSSQRTYNYLVGLGVNDLRYIKNIKMRNNLKFVEAISNLYLSFCALMTLDNSSEFLKYLYEYDATTNSITFTGDAALIQCGLKPYSYGQFNIFPVLKDDIDIIYDLSSATGTGTAQLIPISGAHAEPIVKAKNIKLILPSTYSKVSFIYQFGNDSYGSPNLSFESLEFMASHAPTVSSCSLEISSRVKSKLDNTTRGQAIISAFSAKGWTITKP